MLAQCERDRRGLPGPRRRLKVTSAPLAYSVPDACLIACAGRTALYEAIQSGALRAVKRGRRTLILDHDLRRWVQSLQPVAVKSLNDGDIR